MEDPNDGKIVRTRSKSKSKDSPRKEKKNKKKSKDTQDVNMRSSPDKKDKTPRRTQSDAVPSKTKVEKVDSSCSSGDMQISVQKNPIHPSRSDPCVYPENDPSEEVRSPSRRKRSLSYINNNNGAGNANSSQGNLPKPVKSSKMEIRLSSNSDHGLLPPIPLEDDPPLPPIPKENSWNLPSFVQNFIPRDSKSEISGSEDDDLNSVASDPAQLPPQETDHNRKRANTIATTYGVPFDYSDLEQREGSRNLDDSFASFDQRSFNDDSESNSERKKIGSRRSSARNSGNFNRLNDVKLWLSPRAFGRPRGLSAPPAIVKKKRRGSVVLSPQLIGSNTTDTRRVVEGKLEETDEDRRNTNPSEENFKFETSRPSSASSGRRTNLTVSRHRDSNADSPSMIPKSNTSSDLAYTAKFFEEETDSKAIVRVRSSTTANIKETIKINIHTLNKNKKNRTLKKIQDRSAAHLSGGTFPSLERGLSGMDLETCIKNEKASILFWVFLRSCYHQETYSFWLATEEYRNITDPVLRKRRAVEMHEKYFKSGSEYELSVDDEIKVMIDRETGKIDPSPEIFDEVQFEVWQNLAYLFYPKFQQSSYYRELFSSESNIANGQLSELKRSDTYRRLRLFQSKMGRNRSFSIAVSEPTEYGVAFGVKRGKCASCPCERYRASNKDDVCSCGHWPIKHANMGKASVPLSDIIGEKDKVLIKLMEPGLKLISALCDHCDAENIENVSRSIFYLFDYHERTEELLKFAVAREIRTTRDSKQLFREDKMTFRIIIRRRSHGRSAACLCCEERRSRFLDREERSESDLCWCEK
eukprot:TRINITY_DN5346_c0_g1_i3.p1 TRINITY_DN5346_c0_g1~~TRINITY_DN5346_c0_g1_i3.p1  ORF type:complete len:812 (-),score=167.62 TRINITY_DN5346_c0_g1_i3:976-3411(-)